jgi:hypothetical protein
MSNQQKDQYANKFYGTVTESAANTLTFSEIPTNVDIFSKQAWILHRLDWYIPAASRDLILANLDEIMVALTNSNKVSTITPDNPSVIDLYKLGGHFSTGVGYNYRDEPLIRDFTALPGGGLIIAPRPLFIAIQGVSLATAATGAVRGYFTQKVLSADEYLELVDFYKIVQ